MEKEIMKLRKMRRASEVTQVAVAKAMNKHRCYICNIEKGQVKGLSPKMFEEYKKTVIQLTKKK